MEVSGDGDPLLRKAFVQMHDASVKCSLPSMKCTMALIGFNWLRFTRAMVSGRFAPSTTGAAHPGTLLAALLCWLDARSRGERIALRLEDLDPQRSEPMKVDAMREDLAWLGLSWDEVSVQSEAGIRHEAALDALAEAGALYPCSCSRAAIRAVGKRSPDGGFAYSNACRDVALPVGGWRDSDQPLRARLPEGRIEPLDEGGLALGQNPASEMGDPIVRRRDGGVAYQLASVLDDAALGVTRVVRGRDLATSTATQVSLQRLLALPEPVYRHHALLLEEHEGGKLAKLHGAVGASELKNIYSSRELVGILAHAAALRDGTTPCTPLDLVADFSWKRVTKEDRVMRWTGERLFCVPS
jgi:glutamyl-Q tRNA(Asp) synthetase